LPPGSGRTLDTAFAEGFQEREELAVAGLARATAAASWTAASLEATSAMALTISGGSAGAAPCAAAGAVAPTARERQQQTDDHVRG